MNPADTNGNPAIPFDYYVRYSYADGSLFIQNRRRPGQTGHRRLHLDQATHLAQRAPFTVPSSDGQDPWRAIFVSPATIHGQTVDGIPVNFTGYVVVALPYERAGQHHGAAGRRHRRRGAGRPSTLGTLIAYWTVSRSFRPLSRVEKTAAAIAAGDLSRRVRDRKSDDGGGQAVRLAQRHAGAYRGCVRGPHRVGAADAPLRGRCFARAAYAAGHHPRLLRAVPPRRAARVPRTSPRLWAGSRAKPNGWASWSRIC